MPLIMIGEDMRISKKVEVPTSYSVRAENVSSFRAASSPAPTPIQQRRDSLNQFAEQALDKFDQLGEFALKLGFGPDESKFKRHLPTAIESAGTAAEIVGKNIKVTDSGSFLRQSAGRVGSALLKVTGKALNATTGVLSVAATFHLERKHSDGPMTETPKAFIKATAKTALSTFVVGAAAGAATFMVGGLALPVVAGVGAAIGAGMAFDKIFGK